MRVLIAISLLSLAACGPDMSPAEKAEEDARGVAAVEQANNAEPPLEPVTLEPILYPDIERYDLFGMSCAYAPGTSLGARVIARENDAFIKIGDEVIRLAADPGSRELPMRSRTLYTGKEYSLRLEIGEDGTQSGIETVSYEGAAYLRDRWGRVVFEGAGTVQCGS